MTRFKITPTQCLLLLLLVVCIFFCWFYYIIRLQKAYIAKTPLQNSYEVVLSGDGPESFGVKALFCYQYKEYDGDDPWYVMPLGSRRSYYDQRLVVVNQRKDSTTVNIELIDGSGKTTGFRQLKFQDSLLIKDDRFRGSSAIKIYSLSGGTVGWIDTNALWVDVNSLR